MAADGTTKNRGGRTKGVKAPREQRFYIYLSPDALALLHELADKRGGFARAKSVVIEEAVRRMHANDELVHAPARKSRRAKAEES